jgi:hypothetical protein
MSNSSKGSSGSGAADSMTARTQSWEARTLTVTGIAYRGLTVAEFRRAQADKAHARIEECYRRGLAIPDVR